MKYKKIYVEITNVCNFRCSFCVSTPRKKHFMPVEDFQIIIEKIRPHTDFIYLHVLGEPLLHPQFQEIIQIAQKEGINVNLSTNASLLEKHLNFLAQNPVRQINFSLHDAEENIPENEWTAYLQRILDYSKKVNHHTYINLRLWNNQVSTSRKLNETMLLGLNSFFDLKMELDETFARQQHIRLSDRTFLHISSRFTWPDGKTPLGKPLRNCYALRDHIAILTDGTVVPCCIDADAHLNLGNIFSSNLTDIVNQDRAIRLKKGLQNNQFTEDLCKSCGFIHSPAEPGEDD